MRSRRQLGATACTFVLALAAGCGGGGGAGDEAGAAAETAIPGPEVEAGGAFTAEGFEPSFTLDLPTGWRVGTEIPQLVQFFSGAGEARALSFVSGLADVPPAEVVARLRSNPALDAGEPRQVTIAGREATVVEGTITGDLFLEGTDYVGFPGSRLRAYVLQAQDRTLAIIADAPEADAGEFFQEVEQVLSTLELGAGS